MSYADLQSPLFSQPRTRRGPDKKPRQIRFDANASRTAILELMSERPQHAKDWLASMRAARAAMPTCEAITRTGAKCGTNCMGRTKYCCRHLKGKERDRVDDIAYQKCIDILSRKSAPTIRARAIQRMRAIDKRRLHRAWQKDPTVAGSTLALSQGDEASVRHWLVAHFVDLDDASKEWTFRFVDRCRWASFMHKTERLSEERAMRRIDQALRDEAAWRSKSL